MDECVLLKTTISSNKIRFIFNNKYTVLTTRLYVQIGNKQIYMLKLAYMRGSNHCHDIPKKGRTVPPIVSWEGLGNCVKGWEKRKQKCLKKYVI